jgi:aminotransferase
VSIHISQRVAEVPLSPLGRFFDIVASTEGVVSLGLGEPDFCTPAHIAEAGTRAVGCGDTHYTAVAGPIELRRAIADDIARLSGVAYDPESEIVTTIGVSEGLYLAFTTLLDPGDEVIVPEPAFGLYIPAIRFAGGVPVVVPTRAEDGFQVAADDIGAVLTPRTRLILLGYPNNPTGAVMGRARLEEIGRLAGTHDLTVISDEIYGRLVYGVEHVSVPALPGMRERSMLLNGFSKAYAMTGWRIGYAAGPRQVISEMVKVHLSTIMCASSVAQAAALQALRAGEADVERMRQTYDRRRRLIVAGLNDIGLICAEPHGAFYAFPSIAATGMSSTEFCERLLREEQVAVVPGNAFGASGEGFIRCSYAASIENIERALARMGRFVERHMATMEDLS